MSVNKEARKKWDLKPGNTVKVWQKIKEGEKTRLQAFEGLIIAHKHGFEDGATFTVRKIASGVGVERVFPVFSPNIEKIELIAKSRARRAKLYYVREKAAKEIRKKMKKVFERKTKDEVADEPEPVEAVETEVIEETKEETKSEE